MLDELFSQEMRVVWGDEWASLPADAARRILVDLHYMWSKEGFETRGAYAMACEYKRRIYAGNLHEYASALSV